MGSAQSRRVSLSSDRALVCSAALRFTARWRLARWVLALCFVALAHHADTSFRVLPMTELSQTTP